MVKTAVYRFVMYFGTDVRVMAMALLSQRSPRRQFKLTAPQSAFFEFLSAMGSEARKETEMVYNIYTMFLRCDELITLPFIDLSSICDSLPYHL